jgi:hypothetical protein
LTIRTPVGTKKNHAEKAVMEQLEKMPEEEYGSMADVMKGFGKLH